VGIVNNQVVYTPFKKAVKHIQSPDRDLVRMLEILSL
jgi:hypothetical protein